MSTVGVSSTKLYFNPSTGRLNATEFNSLSDEKFKTNIVTIPNALASVSKLNGVSFNWKDTGSKSFGVIAQEIEKVIPELVSQEGNTKSVNYLGLIAFLINSVTELNQRVVALELGVK